MTPDMSPNDEVKTVRIATGSLDTAFSYDSLPTVVVNTSDINHAAGASAGNDEKTQLFRDTKAPSYKPLQAEQWVQGWLVATTGPMKGQYFPLSYGYNHVGRDTTNSVYLPGDEAISRHQVIIHYNKKNKRFYIAKDHRTTQLTETVEGDLINSEMELEDGCEIIMSESTTLKFVPLCSEQFSWDYSLLPMPTPADIQAQSMAAAAYAGGLSSDDDDNSATVRYDRANSSVTQLIRETPRAASGFRPIDKKDWVQGWLVAISGPMQGYSFPIRYGFNHIGRNAGCNISLPGDPAISGEQLLLVYNRKRKKFYVEKSPQSHQITELSDGDYISQEMELEPNEHLIMTPQTTLRFIPLCGEDFAWDYAGANR